MAAVHYHQGQFPPEEHLDWKALVPHIGPASAAVARYDGILAAVPNPEILLAPLRTREAVLSSRIEGIQATMGDVLEFEAGNRRVPAERFADIQEVINYRNAMNKAEELLEKLPLSGCVIRKTHEVLLSGVRGNDKGLGEYRRVPNWIGPPGSSIETARYVPIGAEELPDAMSNWERYIHRNDFDLLVRVAILHAQFEALHPFLDGNGRLGRMLVPLFLWQRDLIRRPTFYVSAYFESYRETYYEKLLAVSRDSDWTGWSLFFLEALRSQAEDNTTKTRGVLELYEQLKTRVATATRSQYANHALDWIFKQPIFSSRDFVQAVGIPRPTAHRMQTMLQEHDIVKQIKPASGSRPAILEFPELLEIVS